MANTAGVCISYKQDLLNGVHQPGDTYYIALFTSSGTLSNAITSYTSGMAGEVTGTGYSAGGIALSGFTVSLSSGTAYLTWSTNPFWASSTLSNVSAALIYNVSRSNKALAVLTFSPVSSSGNTLTVVLPTAGASSTITLT